MNKLFLTLAATLAIAGAATGQNIKGHYVSKTEADGTIYHTLPCVLFESRELGELTFDITCKSSSDGKATVNFTCVLTDTAPVDSVCFLSGPVRMSGLTSKFYIEPQKKQWKHRYSFTAEMKDLYVFFDASAVPQVTVYVQGRSSVYKVKSSAWKSQAPVFDKIFKMIRINE